MIIQEIKDRLSELKDPDYKEFSVKLIPTVDSARFLGVRVPALRSYAGELSRRADVREFLADLPHSYHEENLLHGFLLEKEKDFGRLVEGLDRFLPYVDNWAACDSVSPKVFKKHLDELLPHIRRWMGSGATYTVRFGIEMLMSFYLDGAFRPEYLEWVAAVRSDEYYVNMMSAWFFATALAKQYEATLPVLTNQKLDVWVHNKTIQKARESYRLSSEQKDYLKSLKR